MMSASGAIRAKAKRNAIVEFRRIETNLVDMGLMCLVPKNLHRFSAEQNLIVSDRKGIDQIACFVRIGSPSLGIREGRHGPFQDFIRGKMGIQFL